MGTLQLFKFISIQSLSTALPLTAMQMSGRTSKTLAPMISSPTTPLYIHLRPAYCRISCLPCRSHQVTPAPTRPWISTGVGNKIITLFTDVTPTASRTIMVRTADVPHLRSTLTCRLDSQTAPFHRFWLTGASRGRREVSLPSILLLLTPFLPILLRPSLPITSPSLGHWLKLRPLLACQMLPLLRWPICRQGHSMLSPWVRGPESLMTGKYRPFFIDNIPLS